MLSLADVLTDAISAQFPKLVSSPDSTQCCVSAEKGEQLRLEMRRLWEDNVIWTRVVIIDASAQLGDLQVAVQRLLRNLTEIGNLLRPFAGNLVSDQLIAALRDSQSIAMEMFNAARANDTAKLTDAKNRWLASVDAVLVVLGQMNPGLANTELRNLIRSNLDKTFSEAVSYFGGNYNQSIADYDAVILGVLRMADILSQGIVTQFPQKM
jgi:uncharacterized protein YejL (UPF0352 family)